MYYLCRNISSMKKWGLILAFTVIFSLLSFHYSSAQCSICTKTAQQLGEKPAQGLNSGILYLAFAPFAIVGFIAYRWWKNNRHTA
jgi:membrane-associated HD superfamily phosphohydrolase